MLTNNHVIASVNEIAVTLRRWAYSLGQVIGIDPLTDTAVLRIPAENLTTLPVVDSEQLRVGDFVAAIGNPFGLEQTVEFGEMEPVIWACRYKISLCNWFKPSISPKGRSMAGGNVGGDEPPAAQAVLQPGDVITAASRCAAPVICAKHHRPVTGRQGGPYGGTARRPLPHHQRANKGRAQFS